MMASAKIVGPRKVAIIYVGTQGPGGAGGGGAGVTSVNGDTGPAVTITKATVGLPLVDNIADANKPVSTAQAAADAAVLASANSTASAALTAHIAAADPHPTYTTAAEAAAAAPVQSVAGRTGAVVLTSTDVGLPLVENKSSATIRGEITSGNVIAALTFTPENVANKGAANGYAPLDGSAKIASAYLPSFVDDVVEAANFAALPGTGETGKIYVTLDNNKTYRWSGSAYVEISASRGSTDAVTEGATNLYFTAARVLAVVLTGLSTATNAVITAADSVLSALGKLQKQISDNLATLTGHTGATNPHSGSASTGALTASGLTISTARLGGRATAGTGAVEELTLSQALDLIGSIAQGDLLYRGASGWSRLPAGTSGQFLKTLGAAANPAWDTVAGGGGSPGGSDPEIQFNLAGALAGANTIRAPLIAGTGAFADAAGRRMMIGAVGNANGLYFSATNHGGVVLTNEACTNYGSFVSGNLRAVQGLLVGDYLEVGPSFYSSNMAWDLPYGARVRSDGGFFFSGTTTASGAANVGIVRDAAGVIGVSLFAGGYGDLKAKNITATGVINYGQFTTAAAPTYVKGASYFDITLNKLRIGGATAWESVTST